MTIYSGSDARTSRTQGTPPAAAPTFPQPPAQPDMADTADTADMADEDLWNEWAGTRDHAAHIEGTIADPWTDHAPEELARLRAELDLVRRRHAAVDVRLSAETRAAFKRAFDAWIDPR